MNWWKLISNIGVDSKFEPNRKRRARLTNRLILIGVLACVPYMPIFYTLDTWVPLIFAICYFSVSLSLFKISAKGKHELSAVTFIIFGNVYLLAIGAIIANDRFFYYTVPLSLFGFALLKKNKTGVILYLLCIVFFFLGFMSESLIKPLIVFNYDLALIVYILNMLVIFFCMFYFFMQLKSTNLIYESSLIEQKREIQIQHQKLSLNYREIQESIHYAKHIQHAILPRTVKLEEELKEHFIIYKPKDIVAGDFYYLEILNGVRYVAVADCTGHGVPGAMVSVICNQALNRSIREFNLKTTGEILNKARELVISELNQSDQEMLDGMDISFCAITGNQLQFTGANRPLWIFRGGKLISIDGDKQPVGKYYFDEPFQTNSFELKKDDFLILASDGFQDQFGGEKGKKLKSKYFLEKLLSISHLHAEDQKKELLAFLQNWMNGYDQIDDICVLGFRH